MSTPDPIVANSNLSTTLSALFAGTETTATLRDGFQIKFLPARMKHLRRMMDVFEAILSSLTQEDFESLLQLIIQQQTVAQSQGKSPMEIDVKDIVDLGKYNIALVHKAFVACLDILPKVVPLFTNLTEEQYDDLLADEAFLIPVGIVGVNYPFFTQSLLPGLKGSLRLILEKRAQAMKATQSALSKQSGKKD